LYLFSHHPESSGQSSQTPRILIPPLKCCHCAARVQPHFSASGEGIRVLHNALSVAPILSICRDPTSSPRKRTASSSSRTLPTILTAPPSSISLASLVQ